MSAAAQSILLRLPTITASTAAQDPLAKVLNDLGIEPFTNTSVKRYKAVMAKKANESWSLKDCLFRLVYNNGGWLGVNGIVVSFFFFCCRSPIVALAIAIPTGLSWLAGALVHAKFSATLYRSYDRARWRVEELHAFTAGVPTAFREQAQQILQAAPIGSKVEVHKLVRSEYVLDPFLCAVYRGKRYYFAVWGEEDYVNP